MPEPLSLTDTFIVAENEVYRFGVGLLEGKRWVGYTLPKRSPGVPTHKRRCTGCGYEDGPWVLSEHVGGGW